MNKFKSIREKIEEKKEKKAKIRKQKGIEGATPGQQKKIDKKKLKKAKKKQN